MEFVTTLEMGEHAGRTTGTAPFVVSLDSRAPEDIGGPAWVLDGLSVRWSAPGFPAQPEPVVASYRLLAADPEDLPPLEVGTLVHFTVTGYPSAGTSEEAWPAGLPVQVATFYGRVSDAAARPVTFQGQAMLEVRVTATDHSVEWAEIYIGAQPWPEESGANRLLRIVEEAGLEEGFGGGGSGYYASAWFRALDVDHRTFADLMADTLRQCADLTFFGEDTEDWSRGVLVPQLSSDNTSTDVLIEPLNERGGVGPRVLVEVDGILTTMAKDTMPAGYTTVQGPLQGVASVASGYTSVDVEWRRDKAALPNRVSVGGEFETRPGFGGGPSATQVTVEHEDRVAAGGPVALRLDSDLKYIDDAEAMASMYLPDRADYAGRWAVERVAVYLSAVESYDDAATLLEEPYLFPWHGAYLPFTSEPYPFGHVLHVHGLQAGHRLAGDYVAGIITGAGLEVRASADSHSRLGLVVELAPNVRRPGVIASEPAEDYGFLPATPGTLARHHPTITPADVDPTLTPYAMRLVRNEIGTV